MEVKPRRSYAPGCSCLAVEQDADVPGKRGARIRWSNLLEIYIKSNDRDATVRAVF
jgi:hypothetical protein